MPICAIISSVDVWDLGLDGVKFPRTPVLGQFYLCFLQGRCASGGVKFPRILVLGQVFVCCRRGRRAKCALPIFLSTLMCSVKTR